MDLTLKVWRQKNERQGERSFRDLQSKEHIP